MPVADVEVDHIDHKAMPQAIEQVTQRAADNQRVAAILFSFCVAFRRLHQHRQHYANTDRDPGNQRCQPPLSARKLKAAP